ncbi:MAG: hypothetical protein LBU76_01355 [Azoarcus sp.]|jgi:hypothetical protein|nr:hypothetical protein [Azoarcus sp.]
MLFDECQDQIADIAFLRYGKGARASHDWKTFDEWADEHVGAIVHRARSIAQYWANIDAEAYGEPELTEWEDPTAGFPKQI